MAQETLKLVITADTQEALANLQTFIATNKGLKEEMQKIGPVSNQATNALSNLSRVAQDAPYGFIGIANNINPLLESFQRLSAGAKDAGTSLTKELKSALTGPAGIGLAVGIVSSLIVAFGDDISDFIDKTLNGNNAIRENAKALDEAKKGYQNAYIEMNKLGQAFEQFNNGSISKKEVLEQYNTSLGKVYGTTKDVNEAEKVYRDNTDKYIQATYLRAAADIELKKAAEEAAKAAETSKMPDTEFQNMFGFSGGFGAGATSTKGLQAASKSIRKERITQINERKTFFEEVAKQLRAEADLIDKSATKTKDFGLDTGDDTKKKDPFAELTKDFQKSLNAQETLRSKSLIDQQTYLDNTYKIYKDYINKLAELDTKQAISKIESLLPKFDKMTFDKNAKDIKDGIAKTLAAYKEPEMDVPVDTYAISQKKLEEARNKYETFFLGIKEKKVENNYKTEQKDLQELTAQYEQFAQTISGTVTNALFSMYEAMQQGENPLQAIADMFKQIAFNIAAMVIQALIFQAIIKAFPALEGAFTALGIIGKATSSMQSAGAISGGINANSSFNAGSIGSNNVSQGQFVLKGSDLVLATQRANNNLNIRRGY